MLGPATIAARTSLEPPRRPGFLQVAVVRFFSFNSSGLGPAWSRLSIGMRLRFFSRRLFWAFVPLQRVARSAKDFGASSFSALMFSITRGSASPSITSALVLQTGGAITSALNWNRLFLGLFFFGLDARRLLFTTAFLFLGFS